MENSKRFATTKHLGGGVGALFGIFFPLISECFGLGGLNFN